jgi:hypothetical protein
MLHRVVWYKFTEVSEVLATYRMIEAAISSETSVNLYQTTRCNIPEDSHLHTCRRENLKFHENVFIICCFWGWFLFSVPRITFIRPWVFGLSVHTKLDPWNKKVGSSCSRLIAGIEESCKKPQSILPWCWGDCVLSRLLATEKGNWFSCRTYSFQSNGSYSDEFVETDLVYEQC